MQTQAMGADAVAGVSVAVVLLTQMVKWAGVRERYGPWIVFALAAAGVALFRYSLGTPVGAADAWQLFVGWVTVAAAASGVYGFSRAMQPAALTRTRPPPPGAGQDTPTDAGPRRFG